MKTAWKHGVLAVDDADSKQNSVFYADQRLKKELAQQEKDFINKRRTECKLL